MWQILFFPPSVRSQLVSLYNYYYHFSRKQNGRRRVEPIYEERAPFPSPHLLVTLTRDVMCETYRRKKSSPRRENVFFNLRVGPAKQTWTRRNRMGYRHTSFKFPASIESRPSVGGRRLITKMKGSRRKKKKRASKLINSSVFFFFSAVWENVIFFLRVKGKWPGLEKNIASLLCCIGHPRKREEAHRPTRQPPSTHTACASLTYTHTHTQLTD